MQPLFETGWALPSSIAPQKQQRSGKAADQRDPKEKSVSKQADQLQNQLSSLKNNNSAKQQKNKKRQNESGQPPSKKAKLNKKAEPNVQPMETDAAVEEQPQTKKQKNKKKKGPKKPAEEKPATEEQKSATGEQKPATEEQKSATEKKSAEEKKPAVVKKNVTEAASKKKAVTKDQKAKLQQLLAKKNESKEAKNEEIVEKKGAKQVKKGAKQEKKEEKTQPTKQANKKSTLTPMQQKMKEKLSGARFRWLNEQLYTTKGDESFTLFKEKPELFDEYHEGFRHQVESWPENPVDIFVKQLSKLPAGTVVADLGCGDAKIAHSLTKQKVLSFDMVAKNDKVVACDIAKLPLPDGFVDVAVFSLALMGTNYLDFLKEAKRILKPGGELKIAEVVSRFTDVEGFIEVLEQLGFEFISKDDSNKMFIMLYFTKQEFDVDEEIDNEMLEGLTKAQKRALKKGAGVHVPMSKLQKRAEKLLKPCVYKKR